MLIDIAGQIRVPVVRATDDSKGSGAEVNTSPRDNDSPAEEVSSVMDLKRQIEGDTKKKGASRRADSTDAVATFLTRRFGYAYCTFYNSLFTVCVPKVHLNSSIVL